MDPALADDERLQRIRVANRLKAERKRRALANSDKPARFLDELVEEDRLRMRLREIVRNRDVAAGRTPVADLPTIAGVHALSFATRYIEGGRERFIEFVQLAVLNNHPAACAFYAVFTDLNTHQREIVSFDDVCCAAGVRPSDLMSCVVACAIEMSRDTGNLVAALTHPEVIRQSVKSGKRIGGSFAEIGLEDRRMLFQHSGFIPVPKNTIVSIHASANAQAAAAASAEPSVPKFSDDLNAVKRDLVIEAPTPKFLQSASDEPLVETKALVAELIGRDD